jgi:capsular exopolysaccharide synthesis family protein
MELSQAISLLRRWLWLIILGVVLGTGAGFLVSKIIPPVYQVNTKILVTRTNQENSSEFASLTDRQLVQTFMEVLVAKPVLDEASRQLNYKINSERIRVEQILDSQVIKLTVEDKNPQRCIAIANTIVDVFILQIENLLTGRYASMKDSLELQISQVEQQMGDLQTQFDTTLSENLDNQLAAVEGQISSLQNEILDIQNEIEALTLERDSAGLQKDIDWLSESNTVDLQAQLANKNARLSVLESDLKVYQQMEADLIASGSTVRASLTDKIKSIEDEISTLRKEITDLNTQNETASLQKEIEWLARSGTNIIQNKISEKQAQLDQLNTIMAAYQQIRVNLIVLGKPNPSDSRSEDPRLQRIQSTLDLYEDIYLNLTDSLQKTQLSLSQNMPNITQIEPPTPPENPVRPIPLLYGLLSGIVGFMATGIIIGLYEVFDNSVRTPTDILNIFGLPVIAKIDKIKNLETADRGFHVIKQPYSPISETFRSLQASLVFYRKDQPLSTILVSSVEQREGKTTIATNLATAYAQSGKKVALLDANSRAPNIHKIFDIKNQEGYSDIIKNDMSVSELQTMAEGISVITYGTYENMGLIEPDKISRLIKEIKNEFDIAIIDGPAMDIADSQIWASEVDGVLLVIKPKSTMMDKTIATRELLHQTNAKLLGIVFNRFADESTPYHLVRNKIKRALRAFQHAAAQIYSNSTSGTKQKRVALLSKLKRNKPAEPDAVDLEDLKTAYEKSSDSTDRIRYQAVQLMKLGYKVEEIEEITGCDRSDLISWEYIYDNDGLEALCDKRKWGINAKLTRLQKEELKERLRVLTPARVLGDEAELTNGNYWTVTDLENAIKQWYGVEYKSRNSYYNLFRYCDFSYHEKEKVYKPIADNPNGASEEQFIE